jgi:zinc/manganese transport system substrate-binding protein
MRKPIAYLATAWLFAAPAAHAAPIIQAIGIENQYANVIAQIGGPYVNVTAIESDPNTDPHSFEVSPKIAGQIAAANLVVENGLFYDDWAGKMLAASPNPARLVINVQHLRHLPDDTPNPHLWYDPATMPAVADALAADLAKLDPAHAAIFQANAASFKAALTPWFQALAAFKAKYPAIPVAVTEPVGNYMLGAAGAKILTPFTLQSAIMNGTDTAPQDVTIQNNLFTRHTAKIFVYNSQVTDPLTQSFLSLARANHVPVIGVYETMPTGLTYQGWMLAEITALDKAAASQISTESLNPGPPS